jgi:hypothetical protein
VSVQIIIQHIKPILPITCILQSVACPVRQKFPHQLITCTTFRKKKNLLNIRYVFWTDLQIFYKLSYFRNNEVKIYHEITLFKCKVPVMLLRFQYLRNFLERHSKTSSKIISYKPMQCQHCWSWFDSSWRHIIICSSRKFTSPPDCHYKLGWISQSEG